MRLAWKWNALIDTGRPFHEPLHHSTRTNKANPSQS
jgi:hypothetical protein